MGTGGSGSRVLCGGLAAGVSSAEEEEEEEEEEDKDTGPAGFLRLLFIAPVRREKGNTHEEDVTTM